MTKKEKFFHAINELGAKRVTEFGWADVPDKNVWVAFRNKEVHIFSNPGGDTGYFDHYIIGVERCHFDFMVLNAIISLTNLDDPDYCAAEDERILLRQFAYDDTDMAEDELMHAVWYLWEHDECITNSISKAGWSRHEEYEDDVDYESMLRLDDEAHSIICQIQGLFNWLDDHNVGYFLGENGNIEFWNAEQMQMVAGADREGEDISLRQAYRTNCITGSTIYMSGIEPRDTGFKKIEK